MLDLLLAERLARRRTQADHYRCDSCGREFEGWGLRQTIRCPDCKTLVGDVGSAESAAQE